MFDRLHALNLLSECTGDEIWSVEYCLQRRIPQEWIDSLQDCYESGFESDAQTIYVDNVPTNQYEGVRDVDIALRVAEYLGIDTSDMIPLALSRTHLVTLIRERIEEG